MGDTDETSHGRGDAVDGAVRRPRADGDAACDDRGRGAWPNAGERGGRGRVDANSELLGVTAHMPERVDDAIARTVPRPAELPEPAVAGGDRHDRERDRRGRTPAGDAELHRPMHAGRAGLEVSPSLEHALRPGDARDVGPDQAATALAEGPGPNELEALAETAHPPLHLPAVDALGDTEVALDLLGGSIEEEAQRDDLLLAFGELAHDLAHACAIEARREQLVGMVVWRRDGHGFLDERYRPPAPGALALVQRLVERRLRQVRANLRRAHDGRVERAVALLLEEHGIGVMKKRLAVARLKPTAPTSEDCENVLTVLLVWRGRRDRRHRAIVCWCITRANSRRDLANRSLRLAHGPRRVTIVTMSWPLARALTRRRLVLVLVVTAALVASDAVAQADGPGTYTVYGCRTPTGAAASMSDWLITKGKYVSIDKTSNACPDGPFGLTMVPTKPHPAADAITATFYAPADTQINGYQIWRAYQLATPYNYWFFTTTNNGWQPAEACFYERGCHGGGDWNQASSASNLLQAQNLSGVQAIRIMVTCGLDDASTDSCPATAPGADLRVFRTVVTLADDHSPVFASPPTGPLVSPGSTLSGAVPVSISASDQGGGVYQVLFEVDGKVVDAQTLDDNGGQCAPPFTRAVPCKLTASGTPSLDTAKVADGTHSLRILVSDATGTNMAAWGPITIRTANASCNPLPRVDTLTMRTRIARGHRRLHAILARYGSWLRVRGVLRTPTGSPVAGATLCVTARDDAGTLLSIPNSSLRTDARGRFSYVVGRGPSRRVYVVYRVPGGAVTDSVRVRIRAPVTLRASKRRLHNGQTLAIRGGLRAGPVPARGLLVELQVWRGTYWQTFGSATTNRAGRYAFHYRFVNTHGMQRYVMRALVPAQSPYPYAKGASKSMVVRVAG
jgi:hypothetical protein